MLYMKLKRLVEIKRRSIVKVSVTLSAFHVIVPEYDILQLILVQVLMPG